MDNSPALSIIIPVLDGALQLNEIFKAFQTFHFSRDELELIVVDDGSKVPIEINPERTGSLAVTVVRNKLNQGRGFARNKGAQHAKGANFLFLDVDCIPLNDFVVSALNHIHQKDKLVFGHISFRSDPFFEYFENNVQKKRAENLDQWQLNMTTACALISREIFEAVGGYSDIYAKYGMEDRDLLIRIHEMFPKLHVQYSYDLTVMHCGEISTTHYIHKFIECGKYSLPLFKKQHPKIFRRMNYAIFDYHSNPCISWIPKPILGKFIGMFLFGIKICYHWTKGYRLKVWCLKLLKGLALLQGTIAGTPR